MIGKEKCPVMLVKDKIETHNDFGNVVSNIKQLIEEYQNYLEIKDVYNFDVSMIPQTPAAAVVFDSGIPSTTALGKSCNTMVVKVIIYLYFETLTPDIDTYSHICRLSDMTRMFYDNSRLYGLCPTSPVVVDGAEIVGRRLGSDVYLTGQINLTVPARFCICEECI